MCATALFAIHASILNHTAHSSKQLNLNQNLASMKI